VLGSAKNDQNARWKLHVHQKRAADAHLLRKQWLEVGLLSEVRQPLTQSRQPDIPTKWRRAYTIWLHIDAHSARIRLCRYCKTTPAASKTGATNLPARIVPFCTSNWAHLYSMQPNTVAHEFVPAAMRKFPVGAQL